MSTSGLKPKKDLLYVSQQESWTEKILSPVGLDERKDSSKHVIQESTRQKYRQWKQEKKLGRLKEMKD